MTINTRDFHSGVQHHDSAVFRLWPVSTQPHTGLQTRNSGASTLVTFLRKAPPRLKSRSKYTNRIRLDHKTNTHITMETIVINHTLPIPVIKLQIQKLIILFK